MLSNEDKKEARVSVRLERLRNVEEQLEQLAHTKFELELELNVDELAAHRERAQRSSTPPMLMRSPRVRADTDDEEEEEDGVLRYASRSSSPGPRSPQARALEEQLAHTKLQLEASRRREYNMMQIAHEAARQQGSVMGPIGTEEGLAASERTAAQLEVLHCARSILLGDLRSAFVTWSAAIAYLEGIHEGEARAPCEPPTHPPYHAPPAEARPPCTHPPRWRWVGQIASAKLRLSVLKRASALDLSQGGVSSPLKIDLLQSAMGRWRAAMVAMWRDQAERGAEELHASEEQRSSQAERLRVLEALQQAALQKLASPRGARHAAARDGAAGRRTAAEGAQGGEGRGGEEGEGVADEARRLLAVWLATDAPRGLLESLHAEANWRASHALLV